MKRIVGDITNSREKKGTAQRRIRKTTCCRKIIVQHNESEESDEIDHKILSDDKGVDDADTFHPVSLWRICTR
jgi:hypothetical protein